MTFRPFLCSLLVVALFQSIGAQTPSPTATPSAESPTPTATPSPSPTATPTPKASETPVTHIVDLIQDLEQKLITDSIKNGRQVYPSGQYSLLDRVKADVKQSNFTQGRQDLTQAQQTVDSQGQYTDQFLAIEKLIASEQDLVEKELLDQVNVVVEEVRSAIPKAQSETDLDDLWLKLSHLRRIIDGNYYGYQQVQGPAFNRLNRATDFLTFWQEYLALRNAGYYRAAVNILQAQENGQTSLLPQDDLAKALAECEAKIPGQPSGKAATPAPTAESIDAILDGMQSGKDAVSMLYTIDSISAMHPSSELTQLESELQLLVACNIDVNESRYGSILSAVTQPNKSPSLWHSKLSKYFLADFVAILPSFVDWKEMPAIQDNEKMDDYLPRIITAARDQKKWFVEQNLLEVWRSYSMRNGTPSWLMGDLFAVQNVASAENMQQAGQFEPATLYYLVAIRFSSRFGPLKEAQEQLAALKTAHPDDYDKGFKDFNSYVAAPPANIGQTPDAPAAPQSLAAPGTTNK